MRVTSGFWVSAFIRRCHQEGAYAVVRRRGAEEAGAIFIVLDPLDGSRRLFGPAPQSLFDAESSGERRFTELPAPDPLAVEERLAKERRFDPDLWVVDVEDRGQRILFDLA